MPKKRANGEGNIRKRKDRHWEGRYTAGHDPETGKSIYKNVLAKTQKECKEKLAAALEGMEQLAARFSDDPERILPEPGPLESARAYREKKAKPPLAQVVKVLRSLYAAYVDLKRQFGWLQGDYGRAREGSERLSDRLQEVKLENKGLRGIATNDERVKRAFGSGEVERAVEREKRREQAEKEQKTPRESLAGGRGKAALLTGRLNQLRNCEQVMISGR